MMRLPWLCDVLASVGVLAMIVATSGIVWSDEQSAATLLKRASQEASNGQSAEAVRLATAAIDAGSVDASVYYLRGREHFRLGQIKPSIADFDRYIQLRPASRARLWERGISCYYGGQFEEGAKQFAEYQTYHGNDVENAVWHVLCNSKVIGFQAATRQLLPIQLDRRVPMMKIYDLFRGQAQPEEVLKQANDDPPSEEQLNRRLFYAHLYLGLYYEARGDTGKAQAHITAAAEQHRLDGYMWDVARVHAERLKRNRADRPASSE